MTQIDKEVTPHKSDDAKGEDLAHSRLQKEANELAKKAGKAEQHYDKEAPLFTK